MSVQVSATSRTQDGQALVSGKNTIQTDKKKTRNVIDTEV